HHLGGLEERVGVAFVPKSRLVTAPPAGAAEGSTPVSRKDRDVIGQAAKADLQGAERLQREVYGEVRPEQVRARDRAEHHGAAREQRARTAVLAQHVRLVIGSVA